MTKSKSKLKKVWSYTTSALLVLIIIILFVPSWRVAFQGWIQSFGLSETSFESNEVTALNEEALNWELFDMESNIYALSDFEGSPIVINFWATWCPSCRAEMPDFGELKNKVDKNVKFIAVTEETQEVVVDAGIDDDYDFIFCTQDFPRFFNVSVYPTLAIVNNKMELIYSHEGASTFDSEKNIEFLNSLLEN
ncbi:MAG: thiol-disulfide isomerase/thioredoxin [Arenicella sp.]|jgi:thiol-disulfide isomerase/thioredoxin